MTLGFSAAASSADHAFIMRKTNKSLYANTSSVFCAFCVTCVSWRVGVGLQVTRVRSVMLLVALAAAAEAAPVEPVKLAAVALDDAAWRGASFSQKTISASE